MVKGPSPCSPTSSTKHKTTPSLSQEYPAEGRCKDCGRGVDMVLAGYDCVVGAFLLLHLEASVCSEMVKPFALINGRPRPVVTLEENAPREFTCRMEGWKSVPVVTWYLNGKRQQSNQTVLVPSASESSNSSFSTFVITTRRKDKELNCSATDPVNGKTQNASVILNVQFKPEVVRMDAEYKEHNDSGLFLALFVLVRANPPATITWVDESGTVIVNTSNFMILDTKSYPWLTNHTVHVQLTSLAKNYSFTAGNQFGVTNSSIGFHGFLHASVEVPMLVILLGGGLGFLAILLLNVMVLCIIYRRKESADVKPGSDSVVHSDSMNVKCDEAHIPRESISLQSNLHLGHNQDVHAPNQPLTETDEASKHLSDHQAAGSDLSGQENAADTDPKGAHHFPMSGYLYKVSSLSSDEIWL
ncbi:transmembrane protein 25 [Amblyraja radiata]|uniref:transmembrane protein 25 n=1 Tax=Amblyraja radiata TaxID=386614 RepID=UPI00140400FA|nr:transmembrane protein 25 [Amblyraja radiata]